MKRTVDCELGSKRWDIVRTRPGVLTPGAHGPICAIVNDLESTAALRRVREGTLHHFASRFKDSAQRLFDIDTAMKALHSYQSQISQTLEAAKTAHTSCENVIETVTNMTNLMTETRNYLVSMVFVAANYFDCWDLADCVELLLKIVLLSPDRKVIVRSMGEIITDLTNLPPNVLDSKPTSLDDNDEEPTLRPLFDEVTRLARSRGW